MVAVTVSARRGGGRGRRSGGAGPAQSERGARRLRRLGEAVRAPRPRGAAAARRRTLGVPLPATVRRAGERARSRPCCGLRTRGRGTPWRDTRMAPQIWALRSTFANQERHVTGVQVLLGHAGPRGPDRARLPPDGPQPHVRVRERRGEPGVHLLPHGRHVRARSGFCVRVLRGVFEIAFANGAQVRPVGGPAARPVHEVLLPAAVLRPETAH